MSRGAFGELLGKSSHKVARKLQRADNQKHRYDLPSECAGIVRQDMPVLEGPGSVFDPYVMEADGGYRMYYSDRASGTVMVAISANGTMWGERRTALGHSDDPDAWDAIVNRACVLRRGGYLMWFTEQTRRGSSIGLATSEDGLSFAKAQNGPVISHAEFPGAEAVMNPCVLEDAGKESLVMWFAAGEQYEPDEIYRAVSHDGVIWSIDKAAPVLSKGSSLYDGAKVGGCDVVELPDGAGYLMFYIGYQNVDVARICAAWSADGNGGWKRFSGNPILGPRQGKWDADAVYKPAAVLEEDSGEIRLWYNGRSGTEEKIGAALVKPEAGLLDPAKYR